MEDINLLKQNNEKLTERLNNAAKFFREQKAQIEALIKENEELKRKPQEEVISTEKWNALAKEKEDLENTIESKNKAYEVLQNTYNEVFTENVNVKKELENKNNELNKIKEDYENKITQLEEDNIKLSENSKLLEDANKDIIKLKEEIAKSNNDYELYVSSATKEINELNNSLKNNIAEIESYESKVNKLSVDLEHKSKDYNDLFKDYNNQIEEIKEKNNIIDNCDNEISRCDDEIKKLKEDIEKSKELYNNLENQKLALENDLSKLEEEHNKLKDQYLILENEKDAYSNSDDALKEIIDVINKYGYEASKDITPAKENVMKTRIGSDKEFGQNVGV